MTRLVCFFLVALLAGVCYGGTTPATVPATATTPATVPATATTPATVPATATTPATVPATATTPATVPATATTPATVPATGTTPATVPATATTPATVPATGTTPATVPATATTPATVPATGTTPATVPATGTTPATTPATGTTPATTPGTTPGTTPATTPATAPATPVPPFAPAVPAVPYPPLAPAVPLSQEVPAVPVVPTAPGATITEPGVQGTMAVISVVVNSVGGLVVTVQSVNNDPNVRRLLCEDLLTAAKITGWTPGDAVSVGQKCQITGVTAGAHKFATLAVSITARLDAGSAAAAQDAIRSVKSSAADGRLGSSSVNPTITGVAAPSVPAVPSPPAAPTAPTAAPTVSGVTALIDTTIVAQAAAIDNTARVTIANTVTQLLSLPQNQGLVTVLGVDATTVSQKFTTAADAAIVHLRVISPTATSPQALFNQFDAAVKANNNNIGQYRVTTSRLVGTSPASSAWCKPTFLLALLVLVATVFFF